MKIRRFLHPFNSLFLGIFVALVLLSLSDLRARSAPLMERTISLDPTSGAPNALVTVYGSGFAGGGNPPHQIRWDSRYGVELASFSVNPNGSFVAEIRIPGDATAGLHEIWACEGCGSGPKREWWAMAVFTVKIPSTSTSRPSPTSTPSPTPTPTRVPTKCDPSGAPGEIIYDFEDIDRDVNLRNQSHDTLIFSYEDPMVVGTSLARSPGSALVNYPSAIEFGSAGAPLEIDFLYVQDFVGVFVGVIGDEGHSFTATLTAWSEDSTGVAVPVGSDSAEIGPGPQSIDVCLSVEAPGQILRITVDYGPLATVGEPEAIDDLILRGPEEPVPVPEDDSPPIVRISSPAPWERVAGEFVRIEGEVVENRGLESIVAWVNDAEYKTLGAARMGADLYWFQDVIDPHDGFLKYCQENRLEVRAVDDAENQGSDSVMFTYYGPGDLEILGVEPVQVLYGAPLVMRKNTAFRVTLRSTFACPVNVEFKLDLPDDQWEIIGAVREDLYPEIWGPVEIPGGADSFQIMLPHVPESLVDQEYDSSSNPAGMLRTEGYEPEYRVLPAPVSEEVSFSVSLDPHNFIPENDEENNSIDSLVYQVKSTGFMSFVAFQTSGGEVDPDCTPAYSAVEYKLTSSLEYLLGTFPFADRKIKAELSSWAETYDTNLETRAEFLGRISDQAKTWGHDFGIAIDCADGGAQGSIQAVVIGAHVPQVELFAHEFNHAIIPMGDVYSLDCYCCWNERYCELSDGSRFYCCYEKPAYDDEREVKESLGIDPQGGCQVNCGEDESETTPADCWTLCEGACDEAGGTVYDCPDGRPDGMGILNASDGFWVNHWEPQEGKTYFMDGPTGNNWITYESLAAEGQHYCPGNAGASADGYLGLINNERLASDIDPPALLVIGNIRRTGGGEFDPFITLPEANLDLVPGSTGAYQIVMLDSNNSQLAVFGFDVSFSLSHTNGGLAEISHFSHRIPWMDGTKRIELHDSDGQLLASRGVSENTPSVELITPNGGETFVFGEVSLRWQGSDDDGDDLTYALAVSDDGGETWIPIAIRLTDQEYDLDASGFLPNHQYLVKVLVTDGVLTGEDLSDEPFSVRNLDPGRPQSLLVVGCIGLAFLSALMIGATMALVFRRSRSKGRMGTHIQRQVGEFCTNCGTRLIPGTRSCSNCGIGIT